MSAHKKVAVMPPTQAPTESAAILSMIDKVIAAPDIPLDRIEKLMDLHERHEDGLNKKAFAAAMVAAQSEIAPIRKDADNLQTRSKYATFDALDRAIRPTYTKHGFALSYNTESPAPDMLRVIAYVMHESGYERQYTIDMPADGKGAKGGDVMTKTHAAGSAFQYGRRYLLAGIFNLATTTRDDDGNAANGDTISAQQVEILFDLIAETQSDIGQFLTFARVGMDTPPEGIDAIKEALGNIKAKDFDRLEKLLLTKKQRGRA